MENVIIVYKGCSSFLEGGWPTLSRYRHPRHLFTKIFFMRDESNVSIPAQSCGSLAFMSVQKRKAPLVPLWKKISVIRCLFGVIEYLPRVGHLPCRGERVSMSLNYYRTNKCVMKLLCVLLWWSPFTNPCTKHTKSKHILVFKPPLSFWGLLFKEVPW